MEVHTVEGMGFSGNIFLIDAPKPCLIDTGAEPDIRYCEAGIGKVLDGRKLELIVLTHRHIDHVGGALSLKERFGGRLIAHEKDVNALLIGDRRSTGADMFGGDIKPMPVEAMRDSEIIDLGGGENLKVIHTPGHTVGSVCLLGDGKLFSGDTVFAQGGVGRWDLETGDYDQLVCSVKAITEMEFDSLYPGHGPSVPDGAKAHVELSLRHLTMYGRFG